MPSANEALPEDEVRALLERAGCNDSALATVIAFLSTSWASKVDPLAVLREKVTQEQSANPQELERALKEAQRELRTTVASLWSAAGGKIQRTHCRKAWTRFMERSVKPLRDELVPTNGQHPVRTWGRETAQKKVIQLAKSFQEAMDGAEVRHEDRKAADSAAQQIVSAIERTVDSAQRLHSAQSKKWAGLAGVPWSRQLG